MRGSILTSKRLSAFWTSDSEFGFIFQGLGIEVYGLRFRFPPLNPPNRYMSNCSGRPRQHLARFLRGRIWIGEDYQTLLGA